MVRFGINSIDAAIAVFGEKDKVKELLYPEKKFLHSNFKEQFFEVKFRE